MESEINPNQTKAFCANPMQGENLKTKQEMIDAIANSPANPRDDSYWQSVAGFKVRMQYRFDFYDLFIVADSHKMSFNANDELDRITSRFSEAICQDGEKNQPRYALFFSDGSQAGVAVLDVEKREKTSLAALSNAIHMTKKQMEMTESQEEELLHRWHDEQEERDEE